MLHTDFWKGPRKLELSSWASAWEWSGFDPSLRPPWYYDPLSCPGLLIHIGLPKLVSWNFLSTFMHTKERYFTFTERHRSTWIIVHIFINAFRKEIHMRQATLETLENRDDLFSIKPTSYTTFKPCHFIWKNSIRCKDKLTK